MAKILVVDDRDSVRYVLKEYLTLLGHSVTTANDGKDGLAAIDREKPELVFSDVNMPIMDGFALAQYLRVYKQETPVVLMTGNLAANEDTAKQFGFDLIGKPFNFPEIDAMLAKFLP